MSATPDPARTGRSDRTATASPLSRRRLIMQGAGVGAAALAAGLTLNAQGNAAAAVPATRPAAGSDRIRHDGPLMVRVVDADNGELDFFRGDRHHRVRNAALAAELLRASD